VDNFCGHPPTCPENQQHTGEHHPKAEPPRLYPLCTALWIVPQT
jgi:hypothetical protein